MTNDVDINHKISQDHSALQYAWCYKGWRDIILILLEHYSNINIGDVRGATPLHRAVSKKNLDIIKLLLEFKVHLNLEINVVNI